MPLILAIEPDRRQASQLRAMVRGLRADLVIADSAEPALVALDTRVPDLILVPALLSPADEAAIGDHLRALDTAAQHVQTLIIPVLASARPRTRKRGVLASLKRKRASAPEGCDPKEFAEQCATYLQRAAAEHARRAEAEADAESDAEADADDVIELDLSALIDALSEPDAPGVPGMAGMNVVAEPPAAALAVAVEWTAVWFPPGRGWPSMEGAPVETVEIVDAVGTIEAVEALEAHLPAVPSVPSRRAAPHPVAPRAPAPVAKPKPIQDEWGFFDPARCGFAALLSKLDEVT